ncbi:MAG: DUF1405 domain-containing protein [Candidatus Altiarchaeota archaeon]
MIKFNKTLFWLIVCANLGGALFGFTAYYGGQLKDTPTLLRIFVPDCPFYALLFGICLGLLHFRVKNDLLYYLISVGAVKYGFWTVFVLIRYSDFYFQPGLKLMYALIFLGHIGLFLEPVMLLGRVKVGWHFIFPALLWYLLNDYVDYVFGTYPPLPSDSLAFMFPASALMSVFFSLAVYIIYGRFREKAVSWD